MLCPKCDYISFDHLTNCTNCNHDLAETASLLNGTSVDASQINYLGFESAALPAEDVYENPELDSDQEGVGEMSDHDASASLEESLEGASLSEGFDPDLENAAALDLSGDGSDTREPDSAQKEEISFEDGSGDVSDEGGGIEFDGGSALSDPSSLSFESDSEEDAGDGSLTLEVPDEDGIEFVEESQSQGIEMPELELSLDGEPDSDEGIEIEMAAEESGDSEQQIGSAEIDEPEEVALQPESSDSGGLDLDVSALTLDTDDELEAEGEVEEASASEDGGDDSGEQTGIDLGDIDLSDLVHIREPESEAVAAESAAETDDSGSSSESVPEESDLSLSLESDDEEASPEVESPAADEGEEELQLSLESDENSNELDSGVDHLVGLSMDDDDDDLGDLDLSLDDPEEGVMDSSLDLDDDKE